MPDNLMQEAIKSTANALQKEMSGDYGERGVTTKVDQSTLDRFLADWPETPKKVATKVIDKYGLPNEATYTRLIWYNTGPWKRTIIYRDEVPHNFPKPHTDLLEQFIDYQVPVDKFDDLAAYDGSVIPERTKGEISARCDMEEMNFLALNLAHEIITGQKTVDEARKTYAETATAFMTGTSSPYTQGLRFETARGRTTDADQMVPGPMMQEMMEKARELVGGRSR
jgi:hypothetical protein